MRNIVIRCKVRELRKELDKIDPVWYNTGAVAEYRKFGGSINNTPGRNDERGGECV